jgi:hypothetical protein
MTDRDLMQQALDALKIAEVDGNCYYEATELLCDRLAHCDRCGKKMGGEGDIHTCTLDPIGDAQDKLIAEMAAQPEQEPVHYGPSSSVFGLAEMILSDCGCSSDYQPLLNRVAARIMGYIDTPPAAQRKPLTDEWIHRTTVLMGFNPEWTTEIGIAHAIVRAAEAAHGIKGDT